MCGLPLQIGAAVAKGCVPGVLHGRRRSHGLQLVLAPGQGVRRRQLGRLLPGLRRRNRGHLRSQQGIGDASVGLGLTI